MQKILQYAAKVPVWSLFPGLFAYVLLRAWYVDPLHDEVATYIHYIETGAIFGDAALLDANNHLLNSLWGRWMYELFGNHFFLFRLANVLTFPVYFAACASLSKELGSNGKRLLFVAALTCIPYLLDYFSYTRGYGMAIGFFFGALASLRLWMKTRKSGWQLAAYGLMLLSVFSSLVCLVCACLLLVYFLFIQLVKPRMFPWKQHLFQVLLHAGFIAGLVPFVRFSLKLKEAGALYYGSLDGFWAVTGKSLSHYVFFWDNDGLKWLFAAAGILLLIVTFAELRKKGFLPFLSTTNGITLVFLFGNVCAVLFLSGVLKVNYPSDRAGMYFVPLGVAALGFLLLRPKRYGWTGSLLLFFPVTLLLTLNLHTSVFSPDDRMPKAFYELVRAQYAPGKTLCVYPLQQLTWARFEQLRRTTVIVPWYAVSQRELYDSYDVIVTKTAFPLPAKMRSQYHVFALADNGFVAYRKKPGLQHRKVIIDSIEPVEFSGTNEFIELLHDTLSPEKIRDFDRLQIRGLVSTRTDYRDLHLVVATTDSAGAFVRFDNFNFRWYHGNRGMMRYNFAYTGAPFSANETELKVYIWNPEKHTVRNTNVRVDWIISKKK
jgi:hypothetical protein